MRTFVLSLLTVLAGVGTLLADTVVVSPGKDNTLYEYQAVNGDRSDGAGSYLFAGTTLDGFKRRAALAFDVRAAVPAGATITSVTLTLRMSRTKAGAIPVTLHRTLADWGEGASNADSQEGQGAAAAPGDATWRHRFYDTSFWASPGGDFVATASASTTVGGNGVYAWASAAMVTDVQLWLDDPTGNFGWTVIGGETGPQTSKRFDSRNTTTVANRPTLSVTYTAPPQTGGCCSVLGGCTIETASSCAALGGTYQGNGTSCSPNPCSQPLGACCDASGTCAQVSSSTCGASGGVYLGNATTCSPNPCPQPQAACCAPSGVCSIVSSATCAAGGGAWQGSGTTCSADLCPVLLTPFVDPLPVPAVAQPVSGAPGGEATYRMTIGQYAQRLHRDLPPTIVWGYNGGYPGPTLETSVGLPITVEWVNDLRDASGNLRTDHYLPVDTCLHGPDEEGASPRTVSHLHGGHVPTAVDGYPTATILPGQAVTYVYPNVQEPATLWYHDHALGITRLNVYMGLAGFYLLRDAAEASLGLPVGEFEIALAVQDRAFHSDGSLRYPAAWEEHFFGDTALVNGKVWPYLAVKQGKYRFRILNGSTSRTWRLALSSPAVSMSQIGTDGGLLSAPVPVERITLGPGERADVVFDFAGLAAGSEVVLTNDAPIMFPGTPGDGVIPNVMKFIVAGVAGHTAPLPAALRAVAPIPQDDAVLSRTFELRKGSDPCTGSAWFINGLRFHDITEYPRLGTTEIWSFVNRSGVMHPMHMHLVMFQVLDRQPFTIVDDVVVPVGSAVPPPAEELGWKDTVKVGPSEIVRVIARFEDYAGLYAYHCHILEHEDNEMMRQFQSIACGNGVKEPTEDCDDANVADGDFCSAACQDEEYVKLAGTAQGGTVRVTIEGITLAVDTTAGASPAAVAAALAAAINADRVLRLLGITALASGDLLRIGGSVDALEIADAGLRGVLELSLTRDRLFWSSLGGGMTHDLVRGSLEVLRTSGGDFTAATTDCLVDDLGPDYWMSSASPAAGEGWWFLVRASTATSPGTWDSGFASQVGSRDAEIAASPAACP